MAIAPVPAFPFPRRPFSSITPFTYSDAMTHLELLEKLRAYAGVILPAEINKVLDEYSIEITAEVQAAIDLMIGTLNDKIIEIDDALADQQADYTQKISDLTVYVDDAVQQVINNAIDLQDTVMAGILANDESETGEYLNQKLSVYGVATVHIITVDGQSNGVGRGTLTGTENEPHPRIFQYARSGSNSGSIIPGVDPFAHPQGNAGVGPISTVVREWINDLPSNDVILVVPNAVGGTYLADITSNGWNPGVGNNRLTQAINATTNAVTAAQAMFPGYRVNIDAVLWVSGETDAAQGVSRNAYESLMRDLIDRYTQEYGPDVKIVLQELSPEQRNIKPGARDAVDSVYRLLARELDRVDIATVPRNMVGYMLDDRLHINTRGQRELYGPADYRALRRVLGGRATLAYQNDPAAPFAPGGIPVIDENFSSRPNETVIDTIPSLYGDVNISTWGGAGSPVLGTVDGKLRFTSGLGSGAIGYWAYVSPVGGEMRYRVRMTTGSSYRIILGADGVGSMNNALVIAPNGNDGRVIGMRAVQYDGSGSNTGNVWTAELFDGEYNIVWAYTAEGTIRVWIDHVFAFEVPRWDSGSHVIGGGTPAAGQTTFGDLLANTTDTIPYVGH